MGLLTPIIPQEKFDASGGPMYTQHLQPRPCVLPFAWKALMQAAALVLVAVLALPAMAADDRPIKSRVSPVYPEIAKRMKITGVVRVEATVEPDGKVSAVKT